MTELCNPTPPEFRVVWAIKKDGRVVEFHDDIVTWPAGMSLWTVAESLFSKATFPCFLIVTDGLMVDQDLWRFESVDAWKDHYLKHHFFPSPASAA
jgi:hypothetical protein